MILLKLSPPIFLLSNKVPLLIWRWLHIRKISTDVFKIMQPTQTHFAVLVCFYFLPTIFMIILEFNTNPHLSVLNWFSVLAQAIYEVIMVYLSQKDLILYFLTVRVLRNFECFILLKFVHFFESYVLPLTGDFDLYWQ